MAAVVAATLIVAPGAVRPAGAQDPTTTLPVTTAPTTAPPTTEPPTTAPPTTEPPPTTEAPPTTAPTTESTTPPTTVEPTTTPTTSGTRSPTTRAATPTTRRGAPPTTAPPATTEAPGTTVAEPAPAPATTQLSSSSVSPFTTPRRVTTTVAPATTAAEVELTSEITTSDTSRLASFVIIVLLGLLGAAVSVTSRRARARVPAPEPVPSVLEDLPVGLDLGPVVQPVPVSAMRAAVDGPEPAEPSEPAEPAEPSEVGETAEVSEIPADGAGSTSGTEDRVPDVEAVDPVEPVEPVATVERAEPPAGDDLVSPALEDTATAGDDRAGEAIDLGAAPEVNLREVPADAVTAAVGAGTMGASSNDDDARGFVMSDPSTARAVLGAPAASEVMRVPRKKKSKPDRSAAPVSRREVTAVAATGSFASWSELSGSVDTAPPASPVSSDELPAVERTDRSAPVWLQGPLVAVEDEVADEATDEVTDGSGPDGAPERRSVTVAAGTASARAAAADEPGEPSSGGPPADVLDFAGAIADAAEGPAEHAARLEPARAAATEVEPELAAELRELTTDDTAERLAEQVGRERDAAAGSVSAKVGALPPIVTAADRNPAPDVLSLVAMTPKERRRRAAAGEPGPPDDGVAPGTAADPS